MPDGPPQVRPTVVAGFDVTGGDRAPGELFRRTELNFGQSRPDGEVTEGDFAKLSRRRGDTDQGAAR